MSTAVSATAEEQRAGKSMYELAAMLFPITRSLTGPGLRQTLDALEQVAGPMERHRFASGEQVFDWTVPREWTIRDAWLKDPDGNVVVSLEQSNLHLVGYSVPVHRRLSLDELQEHLHSLPELPHAVPYRTSYYNESWGFCLSDERRRQLPPGEYEAFIDADLEPGHLDLGEVVVPGRTDDEVLFSTYCCHPSLANNELSGPVLCAHLAAWLRSRAEPPRLTYRFLFLPETIGAIAYLARFGERLRRNLVAGYVATCVGDRGQLTYKRSRRGDSQADRAAEHVLRHHAAPSSVRDFFPFGSDERQYCSPGFDLPVGSLMRTPYYDYPEYHTSLDDMDFIAPEALGDTFGAYCAIVEALEANETFANLTPFCEPQLGKRGLYPTTGGAVHDQRQLHVLIELLNFCDGSVDLLAVAERTGRPISELRPVADLLERSELLRRVSAGPLPR